ncbi:telomere-associated protein RIF1 isoform X2 [Eupeodes corollae]|uniref:telomere-associated protein RIF1 isoform X2 n=1 Tax=Eupeodes corollae TaxID=290404 RepID=UPI0024907F3C|nr:telomere-associated protein RIF1 isoform X2 [Eupeodes corollae]
MDAGLSKAFSGVYNSSKEIIKNNQRHLFCNMLDLLARTTKTTGDKYWNTDEFILFWTTDILPLIFDEDKEIQKSAIAAMETVVRCGFDFKILHSLPGWNALKTKIVQSYSKEIPKYREVSNSCWYKIWCLLIRILDKEIVKGASTINAFLSIVELGFRSPDYNVRTEAFYCWKVLIEIFANNGELCSPKRIRLLYIPLKSSQSKTPQAAIVKLRVWWFLICKLGTHIEQYVDTILETFLAFCYNSLVKGGCGSIEFKEMSVLTLISMLGGSKPKIIAKKMENFELNTMTEKNINVSIMKKFWKSIINYSVEGLKDCNLVQVSGSEFSELILANLLLNVISIENTEAVSFLFDKLQDWKDKSVSENMQKIVAREQFSSCVGAIENNNFLGTWLAAVCKIIITDDTQMQAVDEIIKSIFLLSTDRFRHVLDVFISDTIANSARSLKSVLVTWKLVTKSLLKQFSRSHQSSCDADMNIINVWIVWPLKAYAENQNSTKEKIFDDQFEAQLHMTIERLNVAINKTAFLKETSALLQKMYNLNAIYSDLNAYFACFIRILVSAASSAEYDEELISGIFNILKINLARDFNKGNFELCMKCLKGLVTYLGENGLQKHFADIKDVWSHVINKKRSNFIEKTFFDDYKKQLLDDTRKVASKTLYNKIKNYLDNDDLFVIIPAVWSLNPDKLTERQKEKFYEKSDIPALYNDMSQSQDAFIKPWTPKKLVIAKGTDDEIVIGETANEDEPRALLEDDHKASFEDHHKALTEDVQKDLPAEDHKIFSPPFDSNKTKKIKPTSPKKLIQPKEENIVTFSKAKPVVEVKTPEKPLAKTKVLDDVNGIPNVRLTRGKLSSIETAEEVENSGHLEDYVEQSSPPDRKQTNNSTSPVLKPKTTHLTGRGAQLINMIRNKKHESYSSKQMETSTPVTKMERIDSSLNWTPGDNDSKASPMNLLVFSKTLPSPCASPSASILKRKYQNDSMDDIYDSQAFKRKRVSFHDPPVSITKEYLKDDENKNNSKRCLLLDQEQRSTTKHMLRRSTKMENQIQIDNVTDISGLNSTPLSAKKVKCSLIKCEENSKKDSAELNESGGDRASFPFLFRTETDVLNYVLKQFSMEDICEKYLSDEQSDKAGLNFSRFISNYMNVSPKFKSTILETLSEKHPKEFLDYAIQENLSSVVCDRLNSNTIIDYICSKSQTNISCRTRLFQEIQEILNHDKFNDEKCEFIQKAITSKSMSDQQLLNLIELMFESKRKHQRAVSESAIDSSSTL